MGSQEEIFGQEFDLTNVEGAGVALDLLKGEQRKNMILVTAMTNQAVLAQSPNDEEHKRKTMRFFEELTREWRWILALTSSTRDCRRE